MEAIVLVVSQARTKTGWARIAVVLVLCTQPRPLGAFRHKTVNANEDILGMKGRLVTPALRASTRPFQEMLPAMNVRRVRIPLVLQQQVAFGVRKEPTQ